MKICPTCEHPVPDGARACPTCGVSDAPASPAARRLARAGLWALTVFAVAAVAIPVAESATFHRDAGAPGACAVPEDAGVPALPPGHPPIGNALPPGHPPIGDLPPGHPPIGGEALPPGHPPIGSGAAPSAPLPIFSGPQTLDI